LEKIPLTRNGYEAMKIELEKLKSIERPNIIKAIEEARAHGDLSENAEYDAAKDRQALIEGRIADLEYKIANADIIDVNNIKHNGKVIFGCTVVLENIDTEEEVKYQVVGPDESNIKNGKISCSSPLGKALIGKSIGAEIKIDVPGGKRFYELIDIL